MFCCSLTLTWTTLLSMTQDSEAIPQSSWFESLESLTKQHEGDLVTIEVLAIDLGDEYEAERVPFAYIEYDKSRRCRQRGGRRAGRALSGGAPAYDRASATSRNIHSRAGGGTDGERHGG